MCACTGMVGTSQAACLLLEVQSAPCQLAGPGGLHTRHLLGVMGASPLGQPRQQGTLGTTGCAPSLLVLAEERGPRAARERTPGQSWA